jgi:hypothetical protein
VIERTHAWGNQSGKLRWCTQQRTMVVAFWPLLALALIVVGRLLVTPGPATARKAGPAAYDLLAQPVSL